MNKIRLSILLGFLWTLVIEDSNAQFQLGEPSFAQADGARIAYWVVGEGEPILLVHGFLGRAESWMKYTDSMSEKNQLILVDLRDHGYSTNEKGIYSNKDAASDLVAVLDAVGVDAVDGVGFSAGAMALLNLAISYPERLKSMAVIAGQLIYTDKTIALFKSFHPDSVSASMLDNITSAHERGEEQARALLGYLQDFSEDMDKHFTTGQLASILAPSLIITGDRDLAVPIEQSLNLYRSIPNSYLMVFPNTGHSITPAEKSGQDYLISVLLGFFSKNWKCPAFCDEQ